jgi:hypothetical protein
MSTNLVFKNRRLRICLWNATPGFVSAASAAFDQHMRHLVQLESVQLKQLDDPQATPCDLLIILAEGLDEDQILPWLQSIAPRVPQAQGIPVPSVIFTAISAAVQRELLRWAVDGNWYFDIVDPDHAASLPVRVANFLRLHDHLHEVRRMNDVVRGFELKMRSLEADLETLMKGRSQT